MPSIPEIEKLTPEQAKSNLSAALRDFDLLEPLRKHPYVVVGSAVAAGAVLGSNGKVVVGLTGLTSTLIRLMKPLSGIIAQVAAAKIAAAAAAEQVKQTAPTTEETVSASNR